MATVSGAPAATPDPSGPRSQVPRPKVILWLAVAVAWLATAGGASLLIDAGRQALAPAPTPTPTPSPLEILTRVRAEVVPAEGSTTGYGIAFDAQGYQTLLAWYKSVRPATAWADAYEATDIALPCCAAAHAHRDESQNCGCGHHQALYGATKYLLEGGYSPAQVQAEVNRWKAYMYPKETLAAEMERRAVTDPAIKQALDELKEKGQC